MGKGRRSTVIKIYDESTGELLQKQCSKCKKVKDVSEFYKDKKASGGLRSNCKSCMKERYEANKSKTPEQIKAGWKETLNHMTNEEANEFLLDHMIRITKGDTVLIKRCTECMEYKMVKVGFGKDKSQKDGLQNRCLKCKVKRSKERREANPDYMKEYYEAKIQQALEDIRIIVEADPTKYDYIPGMDIFGIIYLVYNRITKRYYVGQTTISFDIRYRDGFFHNHIDKNEDRDRKPNELLKQDLELYGEESFEFNKLFKVASNQYELDKLEAYMIDKLEAYTKGYNRTRGNWFTSRGLEDKEG